MQEAERDAHHQQLHIRSGTSGNVFDLMQVANLLWKSRLVVLTGSMFFLFVGVLYAVFAKPTYESYAVISPRTTQASMGSSLLTQLGGGMGGMLSGQLGLGGSSLEKLQVIFRSGDIIKAVLADEDIFQRLFTPKERAEMSLELAVMKVKSGMLKVNADPKLRVVRVSFEAKDSVLARDMVDNFIKAVEERIKAMARKESERNRQYLEEQLSSTSDPLIREKVQQLIAVEIEKSIMMGAGTFEILESPSVPLYRSRPQRKQVVVLSFVAGFLLSSGAVVIYRAISSARGGRVA